MKRLVPPVIVLICMVCLPQKISASPHAYIPSRDNDKVIRVRITDGTFASLDLAGGPYGAAVAPDGSFVLVTRTDDNAVTAINDADFGGTGTPISQNVETAPQGVAIGPIAKRAYVANFGSDSVSVIDVVTHTLVEHIANVGDGPRGIAAIESGNAVKVYVSNYDNASVAVITDDGTPEVSRIIEADIGLNPLGVAATPDGRFVYVTVYNAGGIGRVKVIDTADDAVVKTIEVQRGPWGVAVGAQGAYVYVANSVSNTVTVIRTSDHTPIATVPVGERPHGIAAPLNGDYAYVVNQGIAPNAATISEIDMTTGSPVVTHLEMDIDHPIAGAFALGAFIGGPPPSAPSGLNAAAGDSGRVDLTWTDNSDDELGFKIERRVSGAADFVEIAQTAADATTYADGGVAAETIYEYRIRAFNETGFSTYAASGAVTTPENEFHWCFIGTISGEVLK